APSAVSVRPMVTAANRRSDAARLPDRLVLDDKTLPPDILLLGAKQSQEVKCFALGHAERSSPHSDTSLSARWGPMPWIRVRSFPSKEWSALPTSKSGPFDCRLLRRGDPGPSALASSLRPRIELSYLRTDSIRMSQAATFC